MKTYAKQVWQPVEFDDIRKGDVIQVLEDGNSTGVFEVTTDPVPCPPEGNAVFYMSHTDSDLLNWLEKHLWRHLHTRLAAGDKLVELKLTFDETHDWTTRSFDIRELLTQAMKGNPL